MGALGSLLFFFVPMTFGSEHSRDRTPHTDTDPVGGDTRALAQAESVRGQIAALERVVEPVLATMGYELVLLEWTDTARPKVLRLFIDRPGGITLDDCALISPILSTSLDAAEHADDGDAVELRKVLTGAYVLEVSSPGLDRPLARRRHWLANVGARVLVRTWLPVVEGSQQKTFHGRIVAVAADSAHPEDDRAGTVELSDIDMPDRHHHIPLVAIRRANLVYEGDI